MIRDLIKAADPKMNKAIEHLRTDLGSLRTGRANTSLVESISVEYYGQTLPLKQVASVSTPDAKTIAITPWDRANLPVIEKAIRENSALGQTPNNDGHTIRLNIPPLTEERRREIVKQAGEKVEQCHIALRNVRHEILQDIRRLEKDKQVTQDDAKFAEGELNKKIDQYRIQIEGIQKAKEKEIMEV